MATQAQVSGAASIYAKLVMVQEALKAPKDAYNSFGGYAYRSAESILAKAKPLLAQYGLLLLASDTIEMVGDRYYVKSTVTIIDAETGASVSTEAWAREPLEVKGTSPAQISGSSSSYARKYAMQGIFSLSDAADDPDTKDNRDQGQRQPQQRPPQPQRQPQPQKQQPQQRPRQQPRAQQPAQDEMQRRAAIDGIKQIIIQHPGHDLEKQVMGRYKVNSLDALTLPQAKQCIADLAKCASRWASIQPAPVKEEARTQEPG